MSNLAGRYVDAVQTKDIELALHELNSIVTKHATKSMKLTYVILTGKGQEVIPLRFRPTELSYEHTRGEGFEPVEINTKDESVAQLARRSFNNHIQLSFI